MSDVSDASQPLSGCRLLIVEDNFILAASVAQVLEDAGAIVVGPFATMIDALEYLTDLTPIDGAILDIGLEEQESYPLADALQTTRIPFMFLTGVEKRHLPERFANSPHLGKPFSNDKLVQMLVKIGVTHT